MGLFGAEERVDKGTLADVGSAEEGNLRGSVGFLFGGEVLWSGGGEHEDGIETHPVSLSLQESGHEKPPTLWGVGGS